MFLFSTAVGVSKTGGVKISLSFLQLLKQVMRQIKNIFLFYLAVGTSKRGGLKICFSSLHLLEQVKGADHTNVSQPLEQVKEADQKYVSLHSSCLNK